MAFPGLFQSRNQDSSSCLSSIPLEELLLKGGTLSHPTYCVTASAEFGTKFRVRGAVCGVRCAVVLY